MLWTIVLILAFMWLLGMITSFTLGGVLHLHLLLVVALIVLAVRLFQGRGKLA